MDDYVLSARALRKAGLGEPLVHLRDGVEAMEFLSTSVKRGAFALPGLVILDVKLPRISGLEVAAWIRQQPRLRRLLVIVLAGDLSQRVKTALLQAGVSVILNKPLDETNLETLLAATSAFLRLSPNTTQDRDSPTPGEVA